MTRIFRDICNGDPRIAIATLITTLENPARLPWLKLDFRTFRAAGTSRSKIDDECCGCAATHTILNLLYPGQGVIPPIAPSIFTSKVKFANYLDCHHRDLRMFELAIDDLRMGSLYRMKTYFNTNLPHPDRCWVLGGDRGLEDLTRVREYLESLQGIDLPLNSRNVYMREWLNSGEI